MVAGELSPRIAKELKNSTPGALAFAFPYDGFRIVILYDRVREATYHDLTPSVLAHVMVHEITHVLQKTTYHSDTGIMKARWTHDDYMDMKMKPLSFTETDIQLIRSGMAEPADACPPTVHSCQ